MPEWKDEIAKRLVGLRLEPTREAEIIEELSQHLDDRYSEMLAEGATEKEAHDSVILELAGSQLLAQQLRPIEQQGTREPVVLGAGRPNMIADLWQDLRYSVRSLRRHAMLSMTVIVTLTLGIGISTGVFTYFNAAVRLGTLDGPMIYQPFDSSSARDACVFVGFSGDGSALSRTITATVRETAPELSFWSAPQTIEGFREDLMESLWSTTKLIVLLCGMAVGLAVIGIYGVVAFAVSQRTKEMGIRLALGAQKKDIYNSILGSSGKPVSIGLVLGLAITLATWSAVGPLLRSQEFVFNVAEPIAYTVTAIILVCVALTAMLIPARRATKVDPMVALREE